jgi:hypothetical protein
VPVNPYRFLTRPVVAQVVKSDFPF